ncbi:MAG: hypothetical protein NZ481_09885, partial [Candidatus Kapabacteria bacterium]|nr:hypothetical protein [Candidatus Kapabacteria bacterium]
MPIVPPGTGPIVDRDTATITGGNVITFGYSGFSVDENIHIAPAAASIQPGASEIDETPFLTALPTARGNISSDLPGDFGIGQASNTSEDTNFEYNLTRLLRTAATPAEPPIQILSYPSGTSVPTDTVIRIRFSRALPPGALRSEDLNRTSAFQNSRIRIFRTAAGIPASLWSTGTALPLLPGSADPANDFGATGTLIGRGIDTGFVGYRATLEEGGTVLAIRRLERPSFLGGGTIPFESGTTYTVELAIPGLATGTGTNVITTPGTAASPTGQFVRFRFRTVRGIQATGLTVEPANPASPGDSGRIVITFSRPLAPNV